MFNKEEMRFKAKVMRLAQERANASCEGEEADPFLESIYREYLSVEPADVDAWIGSKLRSSFLFVNDPPRWVEEEPSWPFFEGRPMVFIEQYSLPKNEVSEEHLTWGEVLYLFGCRVPTERGYRVEFRIVTQTPGIDGSGLR